MDNIITFDDLLIDLKIIYNSMDDSWLFRKSEQGRAMIRFYNETYYVAMTASRMGYGNEAISYASMETLAGDLT